MLVHLFSPVMPLCSVPLAISPWPLGSFLLQWKGFFWSLGASCFAGQAASIRAGLSPLPGWSLSPVPALCSLRTHPLSPGRGLLIHIAHAVPVFPQSVCAIFEKSVKTLLDDFAPMVPQLCEMLGQMYSTIPQVSAIELTRQVWNCAWEAGHVQEQQKLQSFSLFCSWFTSLPMSLPTSLPSRPCSCSLPQSH